MGKKVKGSFNDAPVTRPSDDAFGISPFAKALAASFRAMDNPVGATVGLNGPWGSGKTSAVNLVRHYLEGDIKKGTLAVVDFRPWWFRGEEALTLAFLQELKAALEPDLGDRAKKLFGSIGRKLLQAGPIIGPAVNVLTAGVGGGIAEAAAQIAGKLLTDPESLEKVMGDLSEALAAGEKRYLVIVDDIDRLTPEEALQVFKLIKSVGRLPNVMYLLVFDRQLADAAVNDRYPSEGPHFLEKIIQANFELPLPQSGDLNAATLNAIQATCGIPQDDDEQVRFGNVFYDAVVPFITLPRHVGRLANAMSVTWPAVSGNVNVSDYVALEVMRLYEPKVYTAVRQRKGEVCGVERERDNEKQATIDALLAEATASKKGDVERTLQRLFPRLERIGYVSDFLSGWDAERRVCIARHFDTYFRLSVGSDVLPEAQLRDIAKRAGEVGFLEKKLLESRKVAGPRGRSQASLILEELNTFAADIPDEAIPTVVEALFATADALGLTADADRNSGFPVENHLRLHWLVRRLTRKLELAQKSALYLHAANRAGVGWLAEFFDSAYRDYHPREGREIEPPENCLLLEKDLEPIKRTFLAKVRSAAADGSLIKSPDLGHVLFRWLEFGGDSTEVTSWTADRLAEDSSVASLARAFTSESMSHGMGGFGALGDRVAKRTPTAQIKYLHDILDVARFRIRLEEMERSTTLSKADLETVATFMKALRRQEKGER